VRREPRFTEIDESMVSTSIHNNTDKIDAKKSMHVISEM
jgi:hypothetical protein